MQRPVIPQSDVLKWLAENHPELHKAAVVERDWLWLAGVNLSGDHNKATREAIKSFGFIFKNPKRGAHVLPDGRTASWAHHCLKPIPFKRKGSDGGHAPQSQGRTETPVLDANLASEIDSALAELGMA